MRRALTAVGVLALVAGCGAPDEAPEGPATRAPDHWFDEVAADVGIGFLHRRAVEQRFWFPEIMGGGGGWLDYDRDGDLDLYLVQSGDLAEGVGEELVDRLYRNDGAGGFVDVTRSARVGDASYGMGVAVGDYDGDGHADVYVTNVGPNRLWRNQGDGTFRDATAGAGVGHPGWGTSAGFLDHDGDGDQDLFVVNYVNWSAASEIECFSGGAERDYCHPLQYNAPAADVLYRNEGDGSFTDVSREAGLLAAFGNGLGLAIGDFDQDGRLDLYVANDGMPNQLWINLGDGRFHDRALLAGCAVSGSGMSEAGMGVTAVDLEADGDLDLFMTHLRDETNTLYRNRGGAFDDESAAAGLAAPSVSTTGFGTGFGDFDHDGRLDLYVVNGRVGGAQAPLVPGDPWAEPNLLLRGVAAARFEPATPRDGTVSALIENSRAAAFADPDGDGDLDIAVVNNRGPARLLRNRADAGAWLGVRLLDSAGVDVPHARARLRAERDRWTGLTRVYSYCASNDPRGHFGLGTAEALGELEILPPGAAPTLLRRPRAGSYYTFYPP